LETQSKLDKIWVVIPVFNHKDTVKDVALGCRAYFNNVLVVDDGSTDIDVTSVFKGTGIPVLRHDKNLGKGSAIKTALDYLRTRDARFMITIDADGQHYPKDLEKFIPLLADDESFILVGSRNFNSPNITERSRLGRRLANFWLTIETGVSVDDCQSGFRAYPLIYLLRMKLKGAYYDFETEILARACWSGLTIKTVPIEVWYPKPNKRISHFKVFLDNFRITLMHIRLVARRLLPLPYPRLIYDKNLNLVKYKLNSPIKLIQTLLSENANPIGLAASASLGVFLATLPLVCVHTLIILYFATRLHLNKIMALAIQNLCVPPFVPIICIELGHFMIYGRWLTDVSWNAVFGQVGMRLWEWFLGSLIVAPILGTLAGFFVYLIAQGSQEKLLKHGKAIG
jgi:glycosyltransferase involved in cell wall biosynthesis